MKALSDNNLVDIVEAFNPMSRYLDDLLNDYTEGSGSVTIK